MILMTSVSGSARRALSCAVTAAASGNRLTSPHPRTASATVIEAGEVIAVDRGDLDHLIKMQPWGGYTRHNRIWKRSTSLVDGMTQEELVTENHAIMMYNPLLSS